MKFSLTAALLGLLLTPTLANAQTHAGAAAPGGRVFAINAQNGSGEHGTFALKPRGDRTTIEIHLLNAPAVSQPAHLHAGSCTKLDPTPKYALKSLTNGISESSVDVPMAKLLAMGLALNVHQSVENLKRYVACGNVTP